MNPRDPKRPRARGTAVAVALATLFAAEPARAQLAPYTVVVDSAAYSTLSSPTTHSFQAFGGFPANDEGEVTLALPFTFNFYGEDYDEVIAYTNGVVAFEPIASGTSILRPASGVPRANDALDAYISGVWQDLEFLSGTSELRTETLGSAPARTFVIEYKDFLRKGQPNDRINFRIELDEEDYTVRVWFGAVSGIFGSTTAIEGEEGRDGLNLLETSASCGPLCACAPASCGNPNYLSGRRITATLPDAPDLYGTVDAPPGASPGTSFDVEIRVENGGLQDAAASRWELWLATNAMNLTGATLLASGDTAAIPALSREEISRTVLLPLSTPVARRFLAVKVDALGDVTEARENNNENIDLAFGTGPDLTGEVSAPFVIGPGEQVTIDVDARSEGAPTTRSFNVRFFLSADQMIDANDVNIGQTSGSLGPDGFSGRITAQPTLPPSLPFTSAFLLARLDPSNAIVEIVENNNDISTQLPLQIETADLEVPLVNPQVTLFQGSLTEVEVDVENTGAARATDFSVCLFLTSSLDPEPPLADLAFEADGITLLPGERARLRLQPTVPTGTIGTVRLVAVADCRDVIDEATEDNNGRGREVIVLPPGPDLAVTWTSTAVPGEAGEPYPLRFDLDNLGVRRAEAQVELVLNGPEASAVVPIFATPLALEPKVGGTHTRSPVLPSDLPSGSYQVSLRARVVQSGLFEPDPIPSNDVSGPRPVNIASFGVGFTGARPPNAVLEQPYRFRFGAIGGDGDYDWLLTWSGSEPDGVSFDAQSGELSGQPRRIGAYPFDLRVSSGGFINTTEGRFNVVPPSLPLTIATRAMPPAVVGEFYAETILVLGGVPPYRFEATDPPLTLQSTGRLTGEPPFATDRFFEVCVTDARNDEVCSPIAYSAIDPGDVIEIGLADLPNGLVDRDYELSIPVTNAVAPIEFAIEGELPPGLSFDAAAGRIFGQPEVAGVYPIVIEARDAGARFDRNPFVLVILEAGSLQIVTDRLPDGRLGRPYTLFGGDPPEIEVTGAAEGREVAYTLGVGSLPPGLELNGAQITGTPTETGTFAFTIVAFDESGDAAQRFYGVTISDGSSETGSSGGGCSAVGVTTASPILLLLLALAIASRRRRTS